MFWRGPLPCSQFAVIWHPLQLLHLWKWILWFQIHVPAWNNLLVCDPRRQPCLCQWTFLPCSRCAVGTLCRRFQSSWCERYPECSQAVWKRTESRTVPLSGCLTQSTPSTHLVERLILWEVASRAQFDQIVSTCFRICCWCQRVQARIVSDLRKCPTERASRFHGIHCWQEWP